MSTELEQAELYRSALWERLHDDSRFRAEMALCDRWGIPHGHFLGAPNIWTDVDQEKALVYAAWKSKVCPNCGTHSDDFECENEPYLASTIRCAGCHLVAAEREHFFDCYLRV